ncbi:SLC13 family permease [Haliangium ochraceum]|uniref:Anion transporter n=1 Tax=Haliangium ochraceum (strain DSM 14365 / JCM 11303 / SMP-2) TaxID=502025 RepID=D0LXQ1_HALO1|nr:SLC13 family permease [Haliangium ochraceum]ACY17806.1 anion transporter [Haliangium ochraceum DSM 14365]
MLFKLGAVDEIQQSASEGAGRRLVGPGYIIGVCGFAGVLAAPWWVAVAALSWLGAGAGAGALLLALLLAGRKRLGERARNALVAALVLAITAALAPALTAMPGEARRTLAVAVLMAAWWVSSAIPIPATSLLPLLLLPALGVMSAGKTAANYANNVVFLFMGGFVLALAIQRWGLHRRIALHIVLRVGTNPRRMVFGFMLATAALSMWISNTATALMMLPIALAVAGSLRDVAGARGSGRPGQENVQMSDFTTALLLAVAYGASIGGLGTPIGTPPNLSFLRIFQILYPDAPGLSFGQWLLAMGPLVLVLLPLAWWVLVGLAFRLPRARVAAGGDIIAGELRALGPMGAAERRTAMLFAAAAVLWVTRGDLDFGALRIPGWAGLLEDWLAGPFSAAYLHDATVAIGVAVASFLIPGEPDEHGRARALMDWDTAKGLPWGILLLFGGGFALAAAFHEAGLSRYLGESFAAVVGGVPPLLLVLATVVLLTLLTELTSNTATTEVMLPVLAGGASALGAHPFLLMLPATLAASCAFMLPIATPPNAIVFGSGAIAMRDMVRAGLWLNLLSAVVIALGVYFVSAAVLGVDLAQVPAWAAP